MKAVKQLVSGYYRNYARYISLDIAYVAAYLTLHLRQAIHRDGQREPQSPPSQRSGCLKPSSRTRARRAFSIGRFFRLTRSGASEVRDAATSAARRPFQSRSRCVVRVVASNVLSGRSNACRRWTERIVTAPARPQGRAQTHRRCHGFYREASPRRQSDVGAITGASDQDRTGLGGSPAQYRTRPGAQKKTLTSSSSAPLPATALPTYERLRAEVIEGRARPEGLGAVIHHGLMQGLAILLSSKNTASLDAPDNLSTTVRSTPSLAAIHDGEFLRLLANMVLQTQAEVRHVY